MRADVCLQRDHFGTKLMLVFLLSFDLFRIGGVSALSSVIVHQDLCSEQPKLTQCQAILNFDRLPTNYNCNPDQQKSCQLNDLVSNDIASCRLDVVLEEKDFQQRFFFHFSFFYHAQFYENKFLKTFLNNQNVLNAPDISV